MSKKFLAMASDLPLISDILTSEVSFHANLGGSVTMTQDAPVPMENVFVNVGNAYNVSGIFTAPYTGVYRFHMAFPLDYGGQFVRANIGFFR